ncbi:hypothetical protein SAMN04488005_0859 [Yoonia tamlensis]|uniref:Uncharacterized protein n=1 Tax=Yoonia tamlensis TaxID=390270 RepID=A0A1I6G0N7_9RHOB|nr:hypothetical protein [Yoonia tamlensis]SFR35710.1 hypothetical protein SAMN04488005_0859 [Yoonia tamlensis]
MKRNSFFGATYILALWVGILALLAVWRQAQVLLEYGFWGAGTPSTQTFIAGLLLSGLAAGLLWAFYNHHHTTLPLFCVMATGVVTPIIFDGSTQDLILLNGSYYQGVHWIAPGWVQLAWVALTILASLELIRACIIGQFRRAGTAENVQAPGEIWVNALYWLVTLWFTVLALNPISEVVFDILHPLVPRREDPVRFLMADIRNLAFPVAIAVALWLRSTAALWLLIVAFVSSYSFARLFELASYWPAQGTSFADHPKNFFLSHPILKLLEIGFICILIRSKIIGRRA